MKIFFSSYQELSHCSLLLQEVLHLHKFPISQLEALNVLAQLFEHDSAASMFIGVGSGHITLYDICAYHEPFTMWKASLVGKYQSKIVSDFADVLFSRYCHKLHHIRFSLKEAPCEYIIS